MTSRHHKPREASPEPRIIDHPDILDNMIDLLSDQKAYGTIHRLASLSKYHLDIVQPRMNRLKNRVVLVLDDYIWRDTKNDKNIEQVGSIPVYRLDC